MARKENWVYLVNALKQDDEKFKSLCKWFFNGTVPSISICARKAYFDLCRNLRGIGRVTVPPDVRNSFKDAVINGIESQINKLLELNLQSSKTVTEINGNKLAFADWRKSPRQDAFDEWHKKACEKICEISKCIEEHIEGKFTSGLAQKWLNMTLKNMLAADTVAGDWYEKLSKIRDLLHVPVDNYVRDAAHSMLGIRGERGGKFAANDAWSLWDYGTYICFQDKVRRAIDYREDYKCPIDWEFDVWSTAKEKSSS